MLLAPRILIVEDEADVRTFFATALHDYGFAVTAAAKGRHALSLLRDSEFELIILDMSLPDMDGLELIRRVRCEFPFLKVAAVSGFMGGALQREAVSSGAHLTLRKPTPPMKLRNAVYRVLDGPIVFRPVAAQNPHDILAEMRRSAGH